MTGFTREYLPLISYYLQVQKCTTGVAYEYFQLVSSRLRAVHFLCCTSPTREYLQIFLRHETLLVFLCKLGCELYCIFTLIILLSMHRLRFYYCGPYQALQKFWTITAQQKDDTFPNTCLPLLYLHMTYLIVGLNINHNTTTIHIYFISRWVWCAVAC